MRLSGGFPDDVGLRFQERRRKGRGEQPDGFRGVVLCRVYRRKLQFLSLKKSVPS
jgi:hypothetical protein